MNISKKDAMAIVPKCIGCKNTNTGGFWEELGITQCKIFVNPATRFDNKNNCLHATHMKAVPKRKTQKLNPLKQSKRDNRGQ